jgi:hypothetical protein
MEANINSEEERIMKRRSMLTIGIAAAALITWGAGVYTQGQFDKYTLKSPGGIAFSDFRGYESWQMVSSARTDTELKVMLANALMIDAYKAGIPGNGRPFPEGSKIVKLQWKHEKSKEAPFVVEVPASPTQAFVMEKDNKRFAAENGGWGYAVFNHDNGTGTMTADAAKVDCGQSCHVKVKNKDFIFHSYQKR